MEVTVEGARDRKHMTAAEFFAAYSIPEADQADMIALMEAGNVLTMGAQYVFARLSADEAAAQQARNAAAEAEAPAFYAALFGPTA